MMVFAIGAPVTLLLAMAPWHFVEKTALARRGALAELLARMVRNVAFFTFLKSRLR